MPDAIQPWHLRQARKVFLAGGIIAYPTETVFGLGCDPLNPQSVERLLKLKHRSVTKGLILIATDFAQLKPYIEALPQHRQQQIFATWPGPNTWLFPAAATTPYWLTGNHSTLAIRITSHPIAAALCRICASPLISTSANVCGHPPAKTALSTQLKLGDSIDYMMHGTTLGQGRPSIIMDGLSGKTVRA